MENTLSIKRVPLDSLHLDPANAREHGPENLDAIIGSLKRFGQAEALVVQASSQRVIGGNGRLVAMRKIGWDECDIVELDVDDLKATALGIALNRTGELAQWNEETLGRMLKELRDAEAVDGVGYSNDEIDVLLADLQGDLADDYPGDEDAIPEPPEEPVTRPGDLWVLGRHRLLCGDSSDPAQVDRLLGGAKIHLINTDPPYNVKVEPRSNNAIAAGNSSFSKRGGAAGKKMRPKDRPLQNDFVSDEDFDRLLLAWFGNMARVLQPGRCFYIWGGYSNCANYPPVLKATGLYFSQTVIWVKEHPVITRKDFMGNHEWCFYGWREGAGHKFFGPNNAQDVWPVKKVNPQSMVHLTEKPVELATRAMQYSSRPGENILDLFGGSGSTMIAAEQTKRNAYLMEIDAPYCDVIVTRWQEFTGKSASLDGDDDLTFGDVAEERLAAEA